MKANPEPKTNKTAKTSESNWSDMVALLPQFADKKDWKDLSSEEWAEALGKFPEFADRCDWNVFSCGGYHDLRLLLSRQPQFADRVPDVVGAMEVGFDFPELLEAAYANCSAPEKFLARLRGPGGFLSVLREDMESERQYGVEGGFSHECIAARLVGKISELSSDFDFGTWGGRATALLLGRRPELAKRCDLNALAGADWVRLLVVRPEFADRCRWESLSEDDWAELLGAAPRFAEHPAWRETGKDLDALLEKPREIFLRFLPDWAGGCTFECFPLDGTKNPDPPSDLGDSHLGGHYLYMLPQRTVVLQAIRPDGTIVGEWSINPLMQGGDPVRLVRKDGPLDAMPENMPGSWSCGIQENGGGVTWTNNPASVLEPRNDAVHPILVSGAFDPFDVTLPWSVIHSPSRRYLVFHVHELEYRGIPVHLEDESTCKADELPDVWIVENGKRIRCGESGRDA